MRGRVLREGALRGARSPANPRWTAKNRALRGQCSPRRRHPLGVEIAGPNTHDSPLLLSSLEHLGRFGFAQPEVITVHLNAGSVSTKTSDLLTELGCESVISAKGFPLQAGRRWPVERTCSRHTWGFGRLLVCSGERHRVTTAMIAMINIRRIVRTAWTTHRWDTRPARQP